MMHVLIKTLLLTAVLSSCATKKQNCTNCGEVTYMQRYIDAKSGELKPLEYFSDRKAWYYDSMVIAEGLAVHYRSIEGKDTGFSFVNKYTFIDLRTKQFADYSSLSDTAVLLDSFTQQNAGRSKGGWNFFEEAPVLSLQTVETKDTVINGSKLTVAHLTMMRDSAKFIQTAFISCKVPVSPFSLEMFHKKTTNCNVLRIDEIQEGYKTGYSTEIRHTKNGLDQYMINMFNHWRNNFRKRL